MTDFDTFIVLDWSGAADTGPVPRKDAIWSALHRDRSATTYHRNSDHAQDWLRATLEGERAAGRRVLVGFDFPFGYPAGFARAVTGARDPFALWDWFGARLPDAGAAAQRFDIAAAINAGFSGDGPFWFNGLKREIDHLPRQKPKSARHGLPDRRLADTRAAGAFTCWQMGGAGAVGGQAMTGLAMLSRLRRHFGDDLAVWPFQTHDAQILLVEVWPSLATAQIGRPDPGEIKDQRQVRAIAAGLVVMQQQGTLSAALQAVDPVARAEEGWIFGVGAEASFRSAVSAAMQPALLPPRLKNDCFALPQGIHWTPVDQALTLLRQRLRPVVASEEIATEAGLHRILSCDHVAVRANPPAANSAVDGYGFAHAAIDGTGRQVLPLLAGRAAAGAPFADAVPMGSAVRILTGALLPTGVDTVILQEDVTATETHIALDGGLKPGANRRRAGEDVAAGAVALRQGQRLRPPDIALLSALGLPRAQVFRRLRVGVLSTGDEIAASGSTADAARTYDANRPMLLALAQGWGYRPVDLGHVGDDRAALRSRLDQGAAEADVIFTSGGASAGDEDHVSALLSETGTLAAWRIAVKPGRPLALAVWNGVPVFGLPGNPVAALVCTLIFARPALSVLAGGSWVAPMGFTVPAGFSKAKKQGRREYLRARLTAEGRAEVFASEGSGRISGLSWAEGLVELEDGARQIAPGDPVRFLPYAGFGI